MAATLTLCPNCNRNYTGQKCKTCERDRRRGQNLRRRYKLERHLSDEERIATTQQERKLEREFPEVVKFPPIKWTGNVAPVRPSDLVDAMEMLSDVDEVRTMDCYDERWTVSE